MTTLPKIEPDALDVSGGDVLDALTQKQRDVLDLLLEHKTSKEISRLLGISPHTVDQRIMLARAKLNVATRNEVAQAYRRLLGDRAQQPRFSAPLPASHIYERSIYGSSQVDFDPFEAHADSRDDLTAGSLALPLRNGPQTMALRSGQALTEPFHHVLPEMFDGPNGTMLRLGAIALIAIFLVLITMGGLAMFEQLSHIVDR